MALWLSRAGKHGEYEQHFLEDNRIYLTWEQLDHDLSKIANKDDLRDLLQEVYNYSKGGLINYSGQVWAFVDKMKLGDWVVVPSKLKSAIHIAEITGKYGFDKAAEDSYRHYRNVKWLVTDIPRSNFDQDLLYSFGAFMTVCQVKRNDAESRVRAMAKSSWKSTKRKPPSSSAGDGEGGEPDERAADLEEIALQQ